MKSIGDKEQTKILREVSTESRRKVKDLNPIGNRLEWVRTRLEMSQAQVCDGTGMPRSSYNGREAGLRPALVEEFVALSMFFNRHWKAKYSGSFPLYNGEEVRKISVEWLLFGHSDVEANADAIIREYQVRISELEEEYFNKEAMLLNQLDLFAKEEV